MEYFNRLKLLLGLGLILPLSVLQLSCGNKQSKTLSDSSDSTSSKISVEKRDSTIYGISDEFGMSTFTLVTKDHDTLNLLRNHLDGSSAKIFGDLDYPTHYALTMSSNGEELNVLINLEQLNAILDSYKIYNCQLVLNPKSNPDTVSLLSLDDNELKVKKVDGKVLTFNR